MAKPLLSDDDKRRVQEAVREAESRTSGEIRVLVLPRTAPDALATAREWFVKLGMEKTRQRNGVLICLGAQSHTFAILGDVGIHREVGDAGWNSFRDGMAERFRAGDFAGGLVFGVEGVGRVLSQRFPCCEGDVNELPDEIVEGGHE